LQTAFKNRIHKILQVCNIRLASRLSDIFGKDGQLLLDALMKGENVDEVIDRHVALRNQVSPEKMSLIPCLLASSLNSSAMNCFALSR